MRSPSGAPRASPLVASSRSRNLSLPLSLNPQNNARLSNSHPSTHSDSSLSLATAFFFLIVWTKMKFSVPALFAALVPVALADVKFVSVNEGDVLTVGYGPKSITVEWVESGKQPKISDLDKYELDLCAGTNDNFVRKAKRRALDTG